MRIWPRIAAQFGNPSGGAGRLAGIIMAHRNSNVERNYWAVDLLNLQPQDRVLEIGFGPGVAMRKMSAIVTQGTVFGIDRSEVMLSQASRRNREGIAHGRVRLFLGSVSALPEFGGKLDKVIDVNSFQFWDKPVDYLKALREKMASGGAIAIAHQPRKPGATDADADQAAEKFSALLVEAGFRNIRINKKTMKPVSTVCILANA